MYMHGLKVHLRGGRLIEWGLLVHLQSRSSTSEHASSDK